MLHWTVLQMVLQSVKTKLKTNNRRCATSIFFPLLQRAFLLDCLTHIAFSIVLRINDRLHGISLEWTVRIWTK